jgi:hypothetical protein
MELPKLMEIFGYSVTCLKKTTNLIQPGIIAALLNDNKVAAYLLLRLWKMLEFH